METAGAPPPMDPDGPIDEPMPETPEGLSLIIMSVMIR